jgi:hypothetical protein
VRTSAGSGDRRVARREKNPQNFGATYRRFSSKAIVVRSQILSVRRVATR